MTTDREQGTLEGEPEDAARRELLSRIGRYAYVAPALTLLVDPAHAGDYRPAPPPRRPPRRG